MPSTIELGDTFRIENDNENTSFFIHENSTGPAFSFKTDRVEINQPIEIPIIENIDAPTASNGSVYIICW